MVRWRSRLPACVAAIAVAAAVAACTAGDGMRPSLATPTATVVATRGASPPVIPCAIETVPPRRSAPSAFPAVGAGSVPPSATPASRSPGAGGSPAPSTAPLTAERAVELVLATDRRFAHAGPRNPRLVGQHDWYEVHGIAPPYRVSVTVGWGDCPSGCISRHVWTFEVSAAGVVTLLSEAGDPLE